MRIHVRGEDIHTFTDGDGIEFAYQTHPNGTLEVSRNKNYNGWQSYMTFSKDYWKFVYMDDD